MNAKDICEILNVKYKSHKDLKGGAMSTVMLINDKYLVKKNTPLQIKAEVEFLSVNKNDLFQKIIYVDPNYNYAVYSFIDGSVMNKTFDKDDVINKIKEITLNYKTYNHKKFGYLDDLKDSWEDFLIDEINYSSDNIKEYIKDNTMVFKAVSKLKKYSFDKKLLHGDFGIHNFIVDKKFVGIIDPQGVIGDYLYDLLFAVVSSSKLLSYFTIDEILNIIDEEKDKIRYMFIIVLYCRISRCLKYHPEDIDIYMKYYKEIINMEI